jgi:hypothetical protein
MGGVRGKYFKDFSEAEIQIGHNSMIQELKVLPKVHPIKELFADAWIDFMLGRFSYDGATFVKERNSLTLFEIGAFLHDWRNINGYVGKAIDNEFMCIMIALNYNPKLVIQRGLFMRLTFLNVLRHKFLGTYKKGTPKNIYKL